MEFNKIKHKIFRSLCISSFNTSGLRVSLLRKLGVTIGEDVVINDGFSIASDIGHEHNLSIGDRVAFGPNVTIVLTSHPNNSRLRTMKSLHENFEVFGSVRIDDDAWIGAGAIILPNVVVGRCSVVGAGSIVTKNVPPYSIVAGNPAEIINSIEEKVL